MDVWLVMVGTEESDHVVSVHDDFDEAKAHADGLQERRNERAWDFYVSGPWAIHTTRRTHGPG